MRWLSRCYLWLHRWRYLSRLERQQKAQQYVISIGNLSMGGTGKTPLTAWLAQRLQARQPMVVLRGYRRKKRTALPLIVSDGQALKASVTESGDEAQLLARVAGLQVVVDPDRWRAIQRCASAGSLVLLDDAFQNPSVYADCQIVILDATIPPDAVRIFPAGHFREGLSALQRADVVVLSRCDLVSAERTLDWEESIQKAAPGLPIFHSRQKLHFPPGFQAALESADALRIGAFCGIGHPEAFFRLLEQSGLSLAEQVAFADHHPFQKKELDALLPRADFWLTTAKDAVRIPEQLTGRERIFVADLEISLDRPEHFLERVLAGPRKERARWQESNP